MLEMSFKTALTKLRHLVDFNNLTVVTAKRKFREIIFV